MKKSRFIKYFEWIVLVVIVFFLTKYTVELSSLDDLKPVTRAEKIIFIVGILIITFIVLAVHELGHLLTGLFNGFRFELFVVGPLGIKRESDKIKVFLNKNLGYYGGVAATTPVNNEEKNAQKFAWILLAGPISSIIFAFLCFIIAFSIGKPLGMVFILGGVMSFGIFLATTVPSRTGMFFTDRKRFQRLIYPGKDREVELAMLRILGTFTMDNSYKNIALQDIELMVSDDYPMITYFGLFNLICYQLENKGIMEEKVMDKYKTVSKGMSRHLVKAFDKEIEKYKAHLKLNNSR